jgi:hypothetical protein
MRTRIAEPRPGTVPPELFHVDDQTWSSPLLFSLWCRRYGIQEPPGVTTWASRFQAAVSAWSVKNIGGPVVDHERLRALGVPFSGSLHRAWALTTSPPPTT